MQIVHKLEKIKFLEKILEFAKEHNDLVSEKGKAIFYDDFPVFDENCVVGILLDEQKNPYFRIKGTIDTYADKIYNPEELLIKGQRYFSNDLDKFKRNFFFYESEANNALDLLCDLKK